MAETVRSNLLKEEIGTPEIVKPRVQEIKERCNWGTQSSDDSNGAFQSVQLSFLSLLGNSRYGQKL